MKHGAGPTIDSAPLPDNGDDDILPLTTGIVAADAGRNQMASSELPDLIRSIHGTLTGLAGGGAPEHEEAAAAPLTPAVPMDASVTKQAITCLECGKGFKTLKRHLSTEHNLSPADYKARWQLSKDYPLVAPSYRAQRRQDGGEDRPGPKAERQIAEIVKAQGTKKGCNTTLQPSIYQ